MTVDEISWLMPLLLIPGIALLIGAASTRYATFQQEVHHLLMDDMDINVDAAQHLKTRAVHFRNALVALHLSANSLAVGSIVGAVLDLTGGLSPQAVVVFFTAVGVLSLVIGTGELIRESFRSQDVLFEHLRHIGVEEKEPYKQ